MDCAKAIHALIGKEKTICELKAKHDAVTVLEVVPSNKNGRPPVIDLDESVIDFSSKTKTAIDIDMYVYPYSMLPKWYRKISLIPVQ